MAAQSLGWVMNTGFGPAPLSWTEIRAFAKSTKAISKPWEFEAIRAMSVAYLSALDNDLDPAKSKQYAGILLPLVLPTNPQEAKLVMKGAGKWKS